MNGASRMIGRRVLVDGMMGSGKSTFARALAARTGLPVIHLDVHYWKPGWVRPSDDEWRERQRALLAGEAWIIDGNYNETLPLRLKDSRMPPTAGDTSRAFVGDLVFPTTADAAICYRWLRSSVPAFIIGRWVTPKPPRKIDEYTVEIDPHKPNQPGSLPGRTGEFDLDILNGHTVVYGESYNAKDAAQVERDGIAVRNVIGD